jgi:hypothetical protein
VTRGAVFAFALVLAAAPTIAQTPPAAPTKPTVVKPVAPKPPVVERAKPAAPAKVASLRNELNAVDLEIAKLKPKKAARDSISEMNKADAALLEALMKKKGELEQMISNLMKAGGENGQSLVANSKGS